MSVPSRATIFIVDDDEGLLRLAQKALVREGFQTVTAGSGKAAMAWLEANHPDLMLLDLKLPDIEGQEFISTLASLGRSVPFIIITGQGSESVAVDMMKRGALDYLVKDVRFLEFVGPVVSRALEKLETNRRLIAAQNALEESRSQILIVSEREQQRFGAELHDGLGQQLTAIEMRCESLRQDLPSSRPDLEEEMAQICQFLRDAISQTRSLARGLSPLTLDANGLTEALGGLAARMTCGRKVKCTFVSPAPVLVQDELVAGHLFRIAQEAVHNALRHSGATEVVISLIQRHLELVLEIADNGRGLPTAPHSGAGIGLQLMKHRSSVIHGDLKIISAPDKGVTVTCTLPIAK